MIFRYCPICGGKMTGFTDDGFPRERCVRCGWVHYHNPRATASAIIPRSGQILLCQRAAGPFVGQWDLPGGFLEEKESAEDGLRREMRAIRESDVSAIDWFDPDRLPTMAFPSNVEGIRAWHQLSKQFRQLSS